METSVLVVVVGVGIVLIILEKIFIRSLRFLIPLVLIGLIGFMVFNVVSSQPMVKQWKQKAGQTIPVLKATSTASFKKEANIIVFEPISEAVIKSPLTIKGQARVFEDAFNYRLQNASGTILSEGYGLANTPDTDQFGPFEIKVKFNNPKTATGSLEVFSGSPADGSEINKVIIPLKF